MQLSFFQRAYPRYESALNIMAEIGDRHGQVEVLAGMAKTLVIMKQFTKVCDCKVRMLRPLTVYIHTNK